MGSLNPYPGQQPDFIRENETEKNKVSKISLLINAIYYFLECVFILHEEDDYRLVVLQQRRVLLDKRYKTLRGAKIAFKKFYNWKAWNERVNADWSQPYNADDHWLEEKLKISDRTNKSAFPFDCVNKHKRVRL